MNPKEEVKEFVELISSKTEVSHSLQEHQQIILQCRNLFSHLSVKHKLRFLKYVKSCTDLKNFKLSSSLKPLGEILFALFIFETDASVNVAAIRLLTDLCSLYRTLFYELLKERNILQFLPTINRKSSLDIIKSLSSFIQILIKSGSMSTADIDIILPYCYKMFKNLSQDVKQSSLVMMSNLCRLYESGVMHIESMGILPEIIEMLRYGDIENIGAVIDCIYEIVKKSQKSANECIALDIKSDFLELLTLKNDADLMKSIDIMIVFFDYKLISVDGLFTSGLISSFIFHLNMGEERVKKKMIKFLQHISPDFTIKQVNIFYYMGILNPLFKCIAVEHMTKPALRLAHTLLNIHYLEDELLQGDFRVRLNKKFTAIEYIQSLKEHPDCDVKDMSQNISQAFVKHEELVAG